MSRDLMKLNCLAGFMPINIEIRTHDLQMGPLVVHAFQFHCLVVVEKEYRNYLLKIIKYYIKN